MGEAGSDLIWTTLQAEREAWGREREAWGRERALLLEKDLSRELAHELGTAALQHKLDVARGHTTVRGALEQICKKAFPLLNATEAISKFCDEPKFDAYLGIVAAATHLPKRDLIKSAKGAYAQLSAAVHSGSTLTKMGGAVPEEVLHDKLTLYAVAALFKFARRDVTFYTDGPSVELKLPSPAHTPPPSAGPSAAAFQQPTTAAKRDPHAASPA